MTSIRDRFSDALSVGETVCLSLERRDGRLVADHPNPSSPVDVAVVEGLDELEALEEWPERPPSEPVAVEIVGRFVENRIAGRVVGLECDPDPDPDPDADANEGENVNRDRGWDRNRDRDRNR